MVARRRRLRGLRVCADQNLSATACEVKKRLRSIQTFLNLSSLIPTSWVRLFSLSHFFIHRVPYPPDLIYCHSPLVSLDWKGSRRKKKLSHKIMHYWYLSLTPFIREIQEKHLVDVIDSRFFTCLLSRGPFSLLSLAFWVYFHSMVFSSCASVKARSEEIVDIVLHHCSKLWEPWQRIYIHRHQLILDWGWKEKEKGWE